MSVLRLTAVSLASLLFLMQNAVAGPPPVPFVSVYDVSSGGLTIGQMTRRFQINAAGDYEFTSHFTTTGLAGAFKHVAIEESSTGRFVQDRFHPGEYRYRKENGRKRQTIVIHFNWPLGRAEGTTDTKSWSAPLSGDELDKLSYQLALASDLREHKTALEYRVPDNGKVDTFPIRIVGEETLTEEKSERKLVRVEYLRRDTRRTTLWCDPARAYLPVKIEYREKDGSLSVALLRR
jgi:hypothetical protein